LPAVNEQLLKFVPVGDDAVDLALFPVYELANTPHSQKTETRSHDDSEGCIRTLLMQKFERPIQRLTEKSLEISPSELPQNKSDCAAATSGRDIFCSRQRCLPVAQDVVVCL
jgi:hypothetical protein